MMKKMFVKCLSAYLMIYLTFGAVFIVADDYWGDFDSAVPFTAFEPEPEPEPQFESQFESQAVEQPQFQSAVEEPQYYGDTPSASEYSAPVYESTYQPPSYDEPLESFDSFLNPVSNNESGSRFVKVIRSNRLYESEFQDAIIEGLQFTSEPTDVEDEIIISCFFIFRDKPTSYFYDLNRKDKKIVFEFADARTGSSPISADQHSPIDGITVEELQVDANKEIKGLNPEWHNHIRVTMNLGHIPVVSVSDESNIISFRYKWTTNPEKYPQYIETDSFPLVFWLSAGGLGAIGIGLLTYFLIPKKVRDPDLTLGCGDLPGSSGSGDASRPRPGGCRP